MEEIREAFRKEGIVNGMDSNRRLLTIVFSRNAITNINQKKAEERADVTLFP